MPLGDDITGLAQAVDPGANSAGQGLGDFLSAVAGHPVNRAQLNYLPIQAANQAALMQSTTGLHAAQTQQALQAASDEQQKAIAGQKKNEATTNLRGSLIAANPTMDPNEADFLANAAVSGTGESFNQATQGTTNLLKQKYMSILADPNAAPNDKFNAAQALKGEILNPTMPISPESVNVSGAPLPSPVATSPTGQADIGQKNAAAALDVARAAQTQSLGGSMTPQDLAYYGHIFRLTGQMPSLGMGASPIRAAIMHSAALEAMGGANAPDPNYRPLVNHPLVPYTGEAGAAAPPGAAPGAAPPTVAAPPGTTADTQLAPGAAPPVTPQAAGDQSVANQQNNKVTQATLNEFGPRGVSGRQVRAINNLSGHMHTMDDLVTALNNGDPQSVNAVANRFQQEFGTTAAPTNVALAGPMISREVLKMLVPNGVGTGAEAAELGQAFNSANTTTALQGALQTLRAFRDRQVLGLEQSYKAGTMDGTHPQGRTDFRDRYLMPDVADEIGAAHGGGGITVTPGEAQAVLGNGNVAVVRNGAWVDTGTKAPP